MAAERGRIRTSLERAVECSDKLEGLAEKIDEIGDSVCRCSNLACAEQESNKLMDLLKDAKEPSRAAQERIMKSMERMSECTAKLAGAEMVP